MYFMPKKNNQFPSISSIELIQKGERIFRVISIVPNEPVCYGCHQENQKITGKLIIDKSMKQIEREIIRIRVIIVFIGIVCAAMLSLIIGGAASSKTY